MTMTARHSGARAPGRHRRHAPVRHRAHPRRWGHRVTGSDMRRSPLTDALAASGVTVLEGHRAENVGDAQLVVTTSAAKDDNPELVEARRRGIPVMKRAEFVAKLMEGTRLDLRRRHARQDHDHRPDRHDAGARRPLADVPGRRRGARPRHERRARRRQRHRRRGGRVRPRVPRVPARTSPSCTNVEPDHLDIYGTFEEYARAFAQFMSQVKPGGAARRLRRQREGARAARVDDDRRARRRRTRVDAERGLARDGRPRDAGRRPDVRRAARRRRDETFEIRAAGHAQRRERARRRSPSATRSAYRSTSIRETLAAYGGARRRFELVGEAAGVTVMDDYAHHPTEVAANVGGRARALRRAAAASPCFQPHTYSRTQYLLEGFRTCFRGLDELLVLATYAAREPSRPAWTRSALAEAIESPQARYVADFDEAARVALELLRPGDVFFTIGAGDVDAVGPMVLEGLTGQNREPERSKRLRRSGSAVRGLVAALEKITPVRTNEPLSRHTTFGIGGPADVYVVAENAGELAQIVIACRETTRRSSCSAPAATSSSATAASAASSSRTTRRRSSARSRTRAAALRFRAESGASFAGVARSLARRGYAGLEWASGIPGTLGGAVVYNAGAYGGCLGDVLRSISIVNGTGSTKELPAEQLDLVYRGSVFTRGQFRERVVLSADFALWPGDAQALMQRVQELDTKRLAAQPRGRNAGSIFKNPPDHPAWRLIDEVGLRGHRIGDAQISDKHCNFFLNVGQARAADVKALIDLARDARARAFGIELELEIALVGEGFDG